MNKLSLVTLPDTFAVCHLEQDSPIPEWALQSAFASITRTGDELSIICREEDIPGGVLKMGGWRAFKIAGPIDISLVGVISSLAGPLAEAGISILNLSTYETDYVFVEDKNLEKATEILKAFCTVKTAA